MVKRYRVKYYTDSSSRVSEVILMAENKIDATNQLKQEFEFDYVKIVDVYDVNASKKEVENFFI
tara:strand:+ start:1582 stop:1773 length:192 start_codon:yes stop_codon:yes gene_type:complete